jgi:hypothetical protein
LYLHVGMKYMMATNCNTAYPEFLPYEGKLLCM